MRTFCTEGPINKEKNYYILREALLNEGLKKIDDWQYFTLFAPRQSGKTTYFQMLIDEIKQKRQQFLPVWISFENYLDLDEKTFLRLFRQDIGKALNEDFREILDIQDIPFFLEEIAEEKEKDMILIIDEIEGLKNKRIMNDLIHTIRKIYHQKELYSLRSVILSGVSNISGIILDNASPFNIADQLNLPYFTKDEVIQLLEQHENETDQIFTAHVKEQLWRNTAGQPGLVNALARDLVEKKAKTDSLITKKHFENTINDFMRNYLDKNISNIINKAREQKALIKKIVFEPNTIEFNVYDERIRFLFVNGVVGNCEDMCCVKVPLYYKALYEYLKPRINGERKFMIQREEDMQGYVTSEGLLNLVKLIDKYRKYVEKRGGIQFKGRQHYEGVYQYNLDAFLTSYVEEIGGSVFPETGIGGGSIDLLIVFKGIEYLIEVKSDPSPGEYKRGKKQIAAYVKRNQQAAGYFVIFDSMIQKNEKRQYDFEDMVINEWVIKTTYQAP